MTARVKENLYSLERDIVSIFGKITGSDTKRYVKVTSCTAHFNVGKTVTGGTSAKTGVITAILSESGDFGAGAGVTIMSLGSGTGDFTAAETLTDNGTTPGSGTFNSQARMVDTVKGKGVASVLPVTTNLAAGVYMVTLEDEWAGLLQFKSCVIDPNSTDDWEVTPASDTISTAKQLGLVISKGYAAAPLTADETLMFELVVSQTESLKGY